ncbi:MAG: hypothetical protein DI538_21215 [Azospira oryzae]|jgi:cytochrome b6-f complex iron-sulfur subunit|nr:MAG: hypothetical protein DI538_21215 [Azospira oryzae]
MKSAISRRQFIRSSCTACLGATATGLVLSQIAASCAPALPVFKTKFNASTLEIPVSSFATSALLIVRDMQMTYDILVIKKSETEYQSIYMECSHQSNPLTATSNGLYCSAHGSAFDLDGNVKTEPAIYPLQKFKTELKNDFLLINISNLKS